MAIQRTPLALIAPVLAVLAANPAHATDGYFLNGIGAKAKGSAGVAIAQPQDALSIAANPAAATQLGERLDVGVEIFIPNRGATIRGNGAGLNGSYSGNGANPFILPEFGYVRQLSDSVAVGIAVYGNGGMNTVYKTNPFASFGATGPAGIDLKQIFVTPTVAVKLAEGQSIGVSPIAVIQGFRATGISPFAAASQSPANFTDRGTDWSAGGGVRVGYLGQFSDAVSIGAFYQSKIWAGKFDKYAGLFAQGGGFDVPASYGAGIAVKPSAALTIAADVKRIEYSDIQSVGNPLSNFADRTMSIQGKYQLTPALAIGATARHESNRCGGQPDTGAGYTATGVCSQPVPAFTVYDLFASYRVNKHLDFRLNVLNASNKDYYTAVYRSGAFLYKGDARAVRFTVNYDL